MMSKRMRVLIAVLVAVVLLTVGSAATATVMADDGSTATSNTTNTRGLFPRVAEILDIPQEKLANAVAQARQEMRKEAFTRCLDKALEKGRIDEDDAGEIKEWWGQRPEVLDSGLFRRALGGPALGGRHMWGGHRG